MLVNWLMNNVMVVASALILMVVVIGVLLTIHNDKKVVWKGLGMLCGGVLFVSITSFVVKGIEKTLSVEDVKIGIGALSFYVKDRVAGVMIFAAMLIAVALITLIFWIKEIREH